MAIDLPSILKSLKATPGGGITGADIQSATDQMTTQFAPQESSITNVINQIQGQLGTDVAAQQQYGTNADSKIAEVGNQLKDQLQGNVGTIGDIYKSGGAAVGADYDQGLSDIRGAGQALRDRLSQSASALGQDQTLQANPYGSDPISRLMAQQASAETGMIKSKADRQSNLATLGTQLQGIAQKAVGDSERQFSQKRADLARDVMKSISQLQLTSTQAMNAQLQKYSDLAATEGSTFRTLINQAATARTATERQAALDAMDLAYKQSQIDKNTAEASKATAQAKKVDDPNNLDNILKELRIEQLDTKLHAAPGDKYLSAAEGQSKLMDYLNSIVRPDRKSEGISGTQYAGIQNFINQNAGQASALNQDPYASLVALAQSKASGGKVDLPVSAGSSYGQKDYNIPLDILLDAIGQRYIGAATTGAKVGTTRKK
jgi:hypothetical protein